MTRTRWMIVMVACVSLGVEAQVPLLFAAAPPPAAPVPARLEVEPGASCDSQFASVEIEPGQTCQGVVGTSSRWRLVPPTESSLGYDKIDLAIQPRQSFPGARPFCVLEWTGRRPPTSTDLKGLKGVAECPVSAAPLPRQAPKATDLSPRDKEALSYAYKAFTRQVYATEKDDVWSGLPKPVASPRIAVLDTTPFGVTQPDASGHGFAVSRVIAQLACANPDSPECANQIKPYVALPLVRRGNAWVRGQDGGHVGYFHQLYDAFASALKERSREQHLIINMSIGWDPSSAGPDDWQRRQMRALLQRASCEGALVITASGNGNALTRGPLLPAVFEKEGAVDPARCRELGLSAGDPAPNRKSAVYRPLIHAVGGVDFFDERLATIRTGAQTRLSTYGIEVAVPARPSPIGFTMPRSSPSVSAAAISGMAAVIWGLRPELDASQVMAAIYEGATQVEGVNRGSHTEVCLDTANDRCRTWPVKRANLCGALNAVLGAKKVACVAPLAFDRHDEKARAFFLPPPNGPKPNGQARPRCPLAQCGVAQRTDPTQVPSLIDPLGISTCAFCRVYSNRAWSNMGLFEGTVMLQPTSGFTVNLYDSSWNQYSYQPIGPTPLPGDFTAYIPTFDTQAAEVVWTGLVGTLQISVVTPLQVVP